MTSFLIQHFDTLKKLVLSVAQMKSISPADCKSLALLIFKKTNQQVSETTLKRVYGFAYSKFKPSLFTLDAMARYCDYEGWADFCEKNNHVNKPQNNNQKQDVGWENIKRNADKITNFTLQALKNRSGIPFNQTIKRKFIDDHFDAFLKDDYTSTIITAPAGYGKTIALCHWVEEKMALNALGASNDIVLFFSSNALINVFISGKSINEWLLALLGYGTEDDFSTLLDIKEQHSGTFYLVIDGLDEFMFKNDQFQLLMNQVTDILSFYQYYTCFKVVLTMRSSTWINNRHELENFEDKCFMGFSTNDDILINVPLFSNSEIEELSTNINPAVKTNVTVEIAENFTHPLYFQFYYKQHKDNFSLNNIDHICIYELISTFILNKIYLGPHSVDKTLFVKLLLENMDFENERFYVKKFQVNDLIKQHYYAYNDLLGIGFIRELNKSGDMQYNTVIEFGNDNFLNYSIARNILYSNSNCFDAQLIHTLNSTFKDGRKLEILKWCMIYGIRNGQHDGFESLALANLTPQEKADVIIFMGDILERESLAITKSESVLQYFQQDCNDNLFNYFFGLEFINADYKKALPVLLKFNLSTRKKIMIYTGLAAIAVIQLDINKLEEYILKLKRFSQEELQTLAINPLSCLETIYYYFKYGIVEKEAFIELTRFYFNPPQKGSKVIGNSENDVLYLLAVYTLSICKNPTKLLRFTNALNKVYVRTGPDGDGYNFLLKAMITEANIESGRIDEATAIYDQVIKAYESNNKAFTPFMSASVYLLKLSMCVLNNKKTCVHELMKSLVYLIDDTDFKLIRIQGLKYVLQSRFMYENDTSFYKRSYYDFIKIVRESGFKEESFINSEVIMAIK